LALSAATPQGVAAESSSSESLSASVLALRSGALQQLRGSAERIRARRRLRSRARQPDLAWRRPRYGHLQPAVALPASTAMALAEEAHKKGISWGGEVMIPASRIARATLSTWRAAHPPPAANRDGRVAHAVCERGAHLRREEPVRGAIELFAEHLVDHLLIRAPGRAELGADLAQQLVQGRPSGNQLRSSGSLWSAPDVSLAWRISAGSSSCSRSSSGWAGEASGTGVTTPGSVEPEGQDLARLVVVLAGLRHPVSSPLERYSTGAAPSLASTRAFQRRICLPASRPLDACSNAESFAHHHVGHAIASAGEALGDGEEGHAIGIRRHEGRLGRAGLFHYTERRAGRRARSQPGARAGSRRVPAARLSARRAALRMGPASEPAAPPFRPQATAVSAATLACCCQAAMSLCVHRPPRPGSRRFGRARA